MDPVRIGIIGCGDITRSHLWGYWSAAQTGRTDFRIVALCSRSRKHSEQYLGKHLGRHVAEEHQPTISPRKRSYKAPQIGVGDLPGGEREPAYHEDWRALLRRDDLDLVEIHLPPAMHHMVAAEALRAGKHVIVEKPLSITVRGGMHVVQAAHDAGRVVSVGLNYRFDPVVRAAQWVVESGQLGTLRLFHAMTLRAPGHWRRPVDSKLHAAWHGLRDKLLYHRGDVVAPPLGAKWRYQLAGCGAGELTENGVHLIDLARALCGEIDRAYGLLAQLEKLEVPGPDGAKVPSETSDTFLSLLRFRSGAIGQVGVSAGTHGEGSPVRENFRVHGDKGSVSQEHFEFRNGSEGDPWELFRSDAPRELRERWFPGGLTHRFGLHKLDMLDALRDKRAPETSAQDGMHTLAACCAIAEASTLGREVAPDDVLALRVNGFHDPIDEALGLLARPAPGAGSGAIPGPSGGAPGARGNDPLRTGTRRRA